MPTGKNWVNFVYVNIAFAIYIAGVFYYNQMSQIKANWPLYRCNPQYMLLADDVASNFSYCIQNSMTNYMGYLLEPLTYVTNSLTTMMGGFTGDIQNIRAMFNKVRTFFTSIIENVFSVFLNLIIEFQRITIGIKDLIGKTIGIMVSLMYIMDGSIKTMNSTWAGPPGQMVKALGKCFYPLTPIKLQNGNIKYIQDIILGDILEDGSIVEAVMQIDNKRNPEPLYKIKNNGVNNSNIYVTGSHLVYNSFNKSFVKVKNYKNAVISKDVHTDWFSCLITSTHNIKIGSELFWDWEDHFIKNN